MNEAKYQVSMTDGQGGIYVIRNDDKEELVLDLEWLRDLLGHTTNTMPQATTVSQTPKIDKTWCMKHNIQMKEREFNGKKWFDHRRKLPDETWEKCAGHGFPSDLRDSLTKSFTPKEDVVDF